MDIGRADRLEIEQVVLRYGFAFDNGDVAGFLDVFTDDGVFEAYLVGREELLSRFRGTAELRSFVESGVPTGGVALHHVSGVLFDSLDADGPRTRTTLIITKQGARGPVAVSHGTYHDRWRRTPDGWRIAHRTYVAAGYAAPPPPE